ncbi:MAG: peptidase M24 [Legionella sp.]|nr:MAG: peptidase M24 [Legionella sp.]PJD99946.1 MAG: peptidase M24 [Legionella sp.]
MAQRPKSLNKQSGKPSRLLVLMALIFVLLFTYFLVKKLAYHKKNTPESISFSIPRPELSLEPDEEGLVDETATSSEETSDNMPLVEPSVIKNTTNTAKSKKEEKKTAPASTLAVQNDGWQIVRPRAGDSMASIFHRLGLSAKVLQEILNKNPHAKVLSAIKPSQELKFLIKKNNLEQLVIPINYVETLTISKSTRGYQFHVDSKKTITKQLYVTATIKNSLYATAQQANIPYKYIAKMTEILKKEVDFSHLHSGDQVSFIYDAHYIGNKMVGTGDIVAISYINNGRTIQAIRHTSANGTTDYYTPQGESFKKAFSRYPIKFSHISSTFALSRNHPILHYKRAHKGIDLAAPIGTPIQATGDGVITVIDRHNGYGNMIKIKHDAKYSSVYGHMLKFQKGLSRGSRVKRGQVIGYVGQTGLATGPHCHYELHVNNEPRNPSTTSLPTASPVPAREIKSFKAKTNTLLAQLKLHESTQLASKRKAPKRIG